MARNYVGEAQYVGDDVDDLIDAVGAGEPLKNKMARTRAEIGKRAPLGFGTYSLTTGSSVTVTGRPQRPFHPDRLLITSSQLGVVVQSIKVGDEEQILGGDVPAEMYGINALADDRGDDFTPSPGGIDFSITLKNTAATTSTGAVGMKGYVKR